MKILIVNNGYLQRGTSGGDRHVLSVGAEWAKQDEVTFVIPRFAAGFVDAKCAVRSYGAWVPQTTLGIVIAYLSRILRTLVTAWRCPAQCTVASGLLVDLLPAWVNALRFKSCLVLYVFHLIPRRKGRNAAQTLQYFISWVAQQIALPFYRRADVIFTDNSLVKEELVALGLQSDRIHVQYPVVDVDVIRQAEPLDRYQVLFVGRLVRQKGVYDLLEAVRALKTTVGIIGEGEERAGLEDYILKHDLGGRVALLGFLPVEEKHRLLKGCDLFVLPSYEEGYGIVIGEAIAAGRPVVAYDLPHYKEVFNNSLLTVPLGNIVMLRDRIQAALADEGLVGRVREQYKSVVLRSGAVAAAEEGRVIASCGALGGRGSTEPQC